MTRDCNTCARHQQGVHPKDVKFTVYGGRTTASCLTCLSPYHGTPLPYWQAKEQPVDEIKAKLQAAIDEGRKPKMILPTDAKVRKEIPLTSGVLDYFPRALAAVAFTSKVGNDQHNPGQPLHWAKHKSNDHADCIPRHLADRNALDTDGIPHRFKLAWRALADLEIWLEENPDKLDEIIGAYLQKRAA